MGLDDVVPAPSPSTFHRELERSDGSMITVVEIPQEKLVFHNTLGRGAYGTVVKGTFYDVQGGKGRPVAVKLIESEMEKRSLENEVRLLLRFKHNHIITVFGVCNSPKLGLVMELMDCGSLHSLLHDQPGLKYTADHVLSWARQTTDAVTYMHERDFVHRDLKPPNLLLTNRYRLLKVCDFGTVSRVRPTMTTSRGSAAWMAPEVFSSQKYDARCDVFSFGIILWEMITRRKPYADHGDSALAIMWKVYSGVRPPTVSNCPSPISDLIVRCWAKNPSKRPKMKEVYEIIVALTKIFPNGEASLLDVNNQPARSPQPKSATPRLRDSTDGLTSSLISANVFLPSFTGALATSTKGHRRTGSHEVTLVRQEPTPQSPMAAPRGRTPSVPYNKLTGYENTDGLSVQAPARVQDRRQAVPPSTPSVAPRDSGGSSGSASTTLHPESEDEHSLLLRNIDSKFHPHLPIANNADSERMYYEHLVAIRQFLDYTKNEGEYMAQKHNMIREINRLLRLRQLIKKRDVLRHVRDEAKRKMSSQSLV